MLWLYLAFLISSLTHAVSFASSTFTLIISEWSRLLFVQERRFITAYAKPFPSAEQKFLWKIHVSEVSQSLMVWSSTDITLIVMISHKTTLIFCGYKSIDHIRSLEYSSTGLLLTFCVVPALFFTRFVTCNSNEINS